MDMSGCTAEYTERAIASAVSSKTMSLYQRLRQLKDLEMAAIEGLETCPFCPFAIVIDNEHEKLFRCQNDECKKVTCRKCKRPVSFFSRPVVNSQDHIPKRCEEVEADLKLNSRHAIEEAMSEALVRKCPHCSKPYIKLDGCNKMRCSACGKLSCFVCRQPIADYDHFDRRAGHEVRGFTAKCPLYDANEARTEAERIRLARDEAQRRALAEATDRGLAVDEADLAVDAPEIPAARAGNPAIVYAADFHPGLPVGRRFEVLNRIIGDARGVAARHLGPNPNLADVPNGHDAAAQELRRQLFNANPALGAPPAHLHRGILPPHGARLPAGAHVPFARPPQIAPRAIRGGDFAARLEEWRHDVRGRNEYYPPPPAPPRYP